MKKRIFTILLCLGLIKLYAQRPYVCSFVDSTTSPVLYNPFKIDTILNDASLTKLSWYNTVLRFERKSKFDEARNVFIQKINTDPLAMYLLGKYYYLGLSYKQDKKSAFLWFYKAGNQNFLPALESMAMMYFYGEDRKPNDSLAIKMLKKASVGGSKSTYGKIGYIFHNTDSKLKNLDSAIYWYTKAIAYKDTSAIHNLAMAYESKSDIVNMLGNYSEGAKNNLVYSIRRLGEVYYMGIAVKKDLEKAKMNFENGCALNDPSSCNSLGIIYAQQKQSDKAYDFFVKARMLNDVYGTYNLGYCLSEGFGIVQDANQAYEVYKKVADRMIEAQNNIGTLYERKLIGKDERHLVEAKIWYEKAATKNNIFGMMNLGNVLLAEGKTSELQAEHWLEKASDTGEPDAIFNYIRVIRGKKIEKAIKLAEKLATDYQDINIKKAGTRLSGDLYRLRATELARKNDEIKENNASKTLNERKIALLYKKSMDYYENGALLEDDSCMVRLGQIYYTGKFLKKDTKASINWWEKAAKLGNATARYNLAYLYEKDEELFKDNVKYENSIKYYKETIATPKVELQLKRDAAFRLGNLYQYPPDNIEKNTKEAIIWYMIAAEQNDVDAMYELGYIYEHGELIPLDEKKIKKDTQQAISWYTEVLKKDANHKDAKAALERLGGKN